MKVTYHNAGQLVLAVEGSLAEVREYSEWFNSRVSGLVVGVGDQLSAAGSVLSFGPGCCRANFPSGDVGMGPSIVASGADSASVPSAGLAGNGGLGGVGAGVCEGSALSDGSDRCGLSRGRWFVSNKRKKERKRLVRQKGEAMQRNWREPPTGVCETVVSSVSKTDVCPSYDKALSDAEREARDTLAQRRAAENKVARKLAEMKLASLEDEKKCQEYADLKHQRIIQWTNEATAKSQQSLDKVKSIDPSSSASQYEIRQQAKKLADSEAEVRRISSIVKTLSSDWQELLERKAESTFNTEYVDELMALGAAGCDNGFNY